ncbi:amidohydrolase family protein [Streptomyces sp. NPDC006487]|uniref:amidohydrolase family protein n=1 Tax=Streptomyces sp. NPDC006487 TaxID=3364748 RepID=UPI0036ADE4F4
MSTTTFTVTGCTIVDPASGQAIPGALSVSDGLIVATPDTVRATVDGSGLFAIPGLIDMHVHATSDPHGRTASKWSEITTTTMTLSAVDNLATALANGITTVRDLGAPRDVGYAVRAAWSRELFVGARPFTSGPVITAMGGHGHWMGVESEGPAAIGALVRRNVANGSDVIKLMMRSAAHRVELRPEELGNAVAEAHWLDVPVAVHANFSERSIDAAVEAGCDTLEHGFAISDSTADVMSKQGTALCPTTTALRSVVEHPQRWVRPGGKELVERAVRQFPEARRSFERALAADVTLIAGTDAGAAGVAFDALPRELRTMVEWGATPRQALAAATSAAAGALRHPELGTLRPGTPADIVLLRSDPLTDVSACAEVEAVIQRGRVVRLDSPWRAQGLEPHPAPGTVLTPRS